MGSHHDHDHHVTENKPVSFITPLILGLVTLLAILLLVSTCDRKKECCEGGKCETECTDAHGEHHGTEATENHHEAAAVTTEPSTVHDTTSTLSLDTAHVHVQADTHTEAHH